MGEKQVAFYERLWIGIAAVMLVVFLILIGYSLSFSNAVPHSGGQISVPNSRAEFGDLGLIETGPNTYDLRMMAQVYSFQPSDVRIPLGAEVTFYIPSPDVLHGFQLEGTNINVTAIPGEIATVKHVFDEPGTYRLICNEYCGIGHQDMLGQIVVEEAL
jgi:cytochrome c oxidase subunit 2